MALRVRQKKDDNVQFSSEIAVLVMRVPWDHALLYQGKPYMISAKFLVVINNVLFVVTSITQNECI